MKMRVGVVGAAGYAGAELVRLLLGHPVFELAVITSNADAGAPLADVYPAFTGASDLVFSRHDDPELAACDAVFLAVPHTAALKQVPSLLAAGVNVFDLSADYRLDDPAIYEAWYGTPHTSPELLAARAFGLPELFASDLAELAARRAAGEAVLVACAGCYPTATSLAAAPAVRMGLVAPGAPVVVDAISGVTGAGKTPSARTHYCHADENLEQRAKQNYTPAKWDIEKYVQQGNYLVNDDRSNVNWYFLRYSDVLLLYAEALNEWHQGPTSDAYSAINKVRRRAYGVSDASVDLSGLDYEGFQEAVRKERAYELCFEGHRRADLVRWDMYYETVQATYTALRRWWNWDSNGNYTPNYVVYNYTVKGKSELLPIPQREIDLCTQFDQNPGWTN